MGFYVRCLYAESMLQIHICRQTDSAKRAECRGAHGLREEEGCDPALRRAIVGPEQEQWSRRQQMGSKPPKEC
jgi:hypothetical protein